MARTLKILTVILSALTVAGGLDLSGVSSFLPEGWAAVLATVPPIIVAVGAFVLALGDQLDDGKKNNSFPNRKP